MISLKANKNIDLYNELLKNNITSESGKNFMNLNKNYARIRINKNYKKIIKTFINIKNPK